MGITWNISPARLFEWLGALRAAQVERQVQRVATRNARKIEEWMKANAPWTDRTGASRAGLTAEVVDVTGQAALVVLRHGVEWGVFLETMQGGSYAIIGPALDTWAPVIWSEIQIELAGGTFGGEA